ncbi:transcription factor SRM1-like [Spinacia oleracea]|uniref:Transcription factor SRM1-like n=1 Tax=Spinacia oleracea TaxID=3562 RepID=A0ABM3QXG4_SPIOL|nr:transcription factor SRM1-like [Spinacia oleracea]
MNYSNVDNNNQVWTRYENKMFENALAELDVSSPSLFEKIMAKMPWKSLEQIKSHYEKLIADIAMIEMGEFCFPNGADVDKKRKGVPWTDEEHRLFLIGLDKLGKGEWKNISMYYVPTKTPSQVASHGQKYFRRLKCCTPVEKRRYSIHDIRILNSSIVETSARNPNRHSVITHIPQHHNQPTHNNKQDDYCLSAEATTLTSSSSSSNNNNNNSSQMIMGNDLGYYDQCANFDELFSAPYDWFPQGTHHMPF